MTLEPTCEWSHGVDWQYDDYTSNNMPANGWDVMTNTRTDTTRTTKKQTTHRSGKSTYKTCNTQQTTEERTPIQKITHEIENGTHIAKLKHARCNNFWVLFTRSAAAPEGLIQAHVSLHLRAVAL